MIRPPLASLVWILRYSGVMPLDAMAEIETYLASHFDVKLRKGGNGFAFTVEGVDYSVRVSGELIQDARVGAYDVGEMIRAGNLAAEVRRSKHVQITTTGIVPRR